MLNIFSLFRQTVFFLLPTIIITVRNTLKSLAFFVIKTNKRLFVTAEMLQIAMCDI